MGAPIPPLALIAIGAALCFASPGIGQEGVDHRGHLDTLLAYIADESKSVTDRSFAVESLANCQDEQVVPVLTRVLVKHRDVLAFEILQVLIQKKDGRALPALRHYEQLDLPKKIRTVLPAAIEACSPVAAAPEYLGKPYSEWRQLLIEEGEPTLFRRVMADPLSDHFVETLLAEKDDASKTCALIAARFAIARTARLIPQMEKELFHSSAIVRVNAVVTLEGFEKAALRSVPALRKTTEDDSRHSIRLAGLRAIIRIENSLSDVSFGYLKTLLEDKDKDDRRNVLSLFSEFKELLKEKHIAYLVNRVGKEEDALFHATAMLTLLQIGERSRIAEKEICRLRGSTDDTVAYRAALLSCKYLDNKGTSVEFLGARLRSTKYLGEKLEILDALPYGRVASWKLTYQLGEMVIRPRETGEVRAAAGKCLLVVLLLGRP